jgi:D-beta-D-heptose 7-phosphate kinase / D-beta-D-heptose 1-phosphate adenosyltransferase
MSYIAPEVSQDIPTEAREVYDVSGAGDTVVATLAAALAAGIPIADAIYLANKAAGIVVGKIGTSPILFKELQDELQIGKPASKLIPIPQLADTIKQLRAQERKIVFTNGCFDILHKGHVCYLEKAKRLGDVLIVGLNSDSSVKRLKGESRPINNENARSTVLAALEAVDYVVIFTEDTPLNLIKTVAPDVLVKGGDYAIENIVGREYAQETVTIPFVDGYSTTKTIGAINQEKQ